ncbi:glutathione-regulated potassium-efflux system protein KefC [Alicycliphilus denitrificans]|uniref:glutathione-regulated potassium-efflux system protein KefC n=1 Tax=Alicycliphilus denitrificans TaxID=179636 RepID=UPI00095DDC26|nr:glutathione-regulated potassium-efflux system protein KefC [Alicycliphilus denitrificans]MBN9575148.1 glutathione-regulated potassium-efflux system protein KefC [Alicycliphilus denitrificans]OJW84710.1 MAG: glutathione-regulated potassium-efflux system protein KefC [Alicycliphilus sp. 69-12]BCN40413.1 glutathione-regulated potassium-efflux system protein KefC [Alicycliphilus denitrificans]
MAHAPVWLTYGFTYLAAAVIAVPIARALGLGAIIGYLAAGIAIGPWGLSLVSNVQDILHFAEFGVVLMLFLVGLELQPARLWSMRRPIFGLGSAQVLGCAALLWAAAWAFGLPWRVGLVGALGLALSSTAIALQVINERNLMRTDSGQKAFSILLFQDVAAIPILALLPLLGVAARASEAVHPHTAQDVLLEALRTIGVVGAIVLGGRLALRPLLRWIARSKTPEIFTAASLFLVVGIAMLMLSVGLSMALGAFLAGVLLADSEYRRELETDIEPFKGLLLGLFFIAVGMSIDFGVILRQPFAMLGLLLGFLTVKALVIWLLARATGMPYQERPVFTLMLAQGGEFAFVVFQAGATFGAIASETASLLIGAVALSMLISPLLLVLLDRVLLKRFATLKSAPQVPEISEPQSAPVIIAGFGRYGQIVARLMLAQGVPATVLDHSVEMLEVAHTFGYRVFYGDATRVNLLRMAGAEQARILVVAVDAPDQSLKIVQLAKKHFPHLQVVARARDVTHWHSLRDLGVTHVERELFESSLRTARTVLELTGLPPQEADRLAERFRAHNIALSERMYEHHNDREAMIAVAKQGRRQLVEQLAKERQERMAAAEAGSGLTPDVPQPAEDS